MVPRHASGRYARSRATGFRTIDDLYRGVSNLDVTSVSSAPSGYPMRNLVFVIYRRDIRRPRHQLPRRALAPNLRWPASLHGTLSARADSTSSAKQVLR